MSFKIFFLTKSESLLVLIRTKSELMLVWATIVWMLVCLHHSDNLLVCLCYHVSVSVVVIVS